MMSRTENTTGRHSATEPRYKRNISPPLLALMWATFAIMIACNIGFEQLRFGGTTSQMVSGEVFSWFTPADYVFSIWPIIYIAMSIWLGVFTRDAMHARKADMMARSASARENRNASRSATRSMPVARINRIPNRNLISSPTALMFIVSCGLNVAWLTTWHLRMIAASVIIIAAFMAVLGFLYFSVFESTDRQSYRIPISLYFSWISVATVANCMYLLTYLGMGEMSIMQAILTVIIAIFYLAQVALMKSSFNDMVFGFVVAWALVGIGIHIAPVSLPVAVTCYVIAGASLLLCLIPWEQTLVKTRTI